MITDNKPVVLDGYIQADVTSSPFPLLNMVGFSVQAVITTDGYSTPTGTLKLQMSVDPGTSFNGAGLTHWTDVPGSSVAVSGSQTSVWNVSAAYYPWVRVVYTHATGYGTLNVRINAKGLH